MTLDLDPEEWAERLERTPKLERGPVVPISLLRDPALCDLWVRVYAEHIEMDRFDPKWAERSRKAAADAAVRAASESVPGHPVEARP